MLWLTHPTRTRSSLQRGRDYVFAVESMGSSGADARPSPAEHIYLLSPAHCGGKRAELLLDPRASFALAQALRSPRGAPLGELYSFMSSLYFRGKLTYATHFGRASGADGEPPVAAGEVPASLIITPGHGLCRASTLVGMGELRGIARVEVDANNPSFVEPLLRDAKLLEKALPSSAGVVLLGSIATGKYVGPLLQVFGARLLFPREFVGRGDMSRGGLLLRAVRLDEPLELVPVAGTARRGTRARRLVDLPALERRRVDER
jgi:hypothetical protein